MDILLAVNKRDFYQQAVTAAVPPPYLVTGHQIRSLPPTYTAKKRKRKKKKWEMGKKTFKESKLAAQTGRTLCKFQCIFFPL